MRNVTRLLPALLLGGILASGGCGKKEEQSTRFNRTLGDSPIGAPVAPGSVDAGILEDQTAYRPASYEPLEGGTAGGAGAGGGESAGPEVEAIRTLLTDYVTAILELDIELVLDMYVPEQVAVLTEDPYMSTLYETTETISTFWTVFADKVAGSDLEPLVTLVELLPNLAEPLAGAMTITVLDEENAVAAFDMEKFELPEEVQAEFEAAGEAVMGLVMGSMMGAMGEGGAPPEDLAAEMPDMPAGGLSPDMLQQMMAMSGGGPGEGGMDQPLRKVDGEWKLTLPAAVGEEQAELINDGLLLAKDLMAAITAQVDQTETLDAAAFMQIASQTGTRMLPAFMGWAARAQMMAAAMAPGETDDAGSGEPPEGEEEEEPNEPDADTGAGRGGRSRTP